MSRWWLVALAVLLVVACDSQGTTVSLTELPDVSGQVDSGVETDGTETPDIAVSPDQFVLPELVFDVLPDTPFVECEPGTGCFLDPCIENSDCQSGWCVEHMGEAVCTMPCQEECPPGWSCQQVSGGNPDVVYICVSDVSNLCKPCRTGDNCKSPGGNEDVCLDYGAEGSFCGSICASDDDCPWGFSCADSKTVDGIDTRQCLSDAGVCPCTGKSVKLALWTGCAVTNEFGVCPGKRICSDGGLTDCDALVPAPETCNGLDDDCDGDVDEPNVFEGDFVNPCDDGNPCTKDTCLGEAGCAHDVLSEGECADGDACTIGDHCDAGVCTGLPIICDDSNPCTDDFCDGLGGCTNEFNLAACDDGDPCTVNDQCSQGECSGFAVACDCQSDSDCAALEDGDLCNGTLICQKNKLPYQCIVAPATVVTCPAPVGPDGVCVKAACDPLTGNCSLAADHEGFACDDENPCTVGDACAGGECVGGVAVVCDDGNGCTDDACDPDDGCVYLPNSGPCDDGNACTSGDHCGGGLCLYDAVVDCDDGDPCTNDSCTPQGGCVYTQNTAPCDDQNVCTTGDQCAQGQCVGTVPVVCNDNNGCTDDSCDAQTGCVFAPNVAPCDDQNPCTLNDLCTGGMCQGSGALDCDDGNPCTNDACDGAKGCVHKSNTAPCDDGSACTVGDLCAQGACVGGAPLVCNDNNGCTDDSCDDDAGCQFVPNEADCNDGNLCTLADKCSQGTCQGTQAVNCNDDNLCTTDSCTPLQGCIHTFNSAPCDDQDACTIGEKCELGQCASGGQLNCNDGNVCTLDSCDAKVGCEFVPTAGACSDSNACTVGDACLDGECAAGEPLNCDDNNPCTLDTCHPADGCEYTAIDGACDDKDQCTTVDACVEGVCVGSVPLECLDSNPCTNDGCNAQTGCTFIANDAFCDDGDACTTLDQCSQGSCLGGPALSCDDSKECTTDSCDSDSGCVFTPVEDGTACTQNGGVVCASGTCVEYQPGSQIFTYTGGAQTFTVPPGVSKVRVAVVGGGGGGAGSHYGGGGSGYVLYGSYDVAGTVTVTVGSGGNGGISGTNDAPGSKGGTSSFGGHLSASGGNGGNTNGPGGGHGGSGGGGAGNSGCAGKGGAGGSAGQGGCSYPGGSGGHFDNFNAMQFKSLTAGAGGAAGTSSHSGGGGAGGLLIDGAGPAAGNGGESWSGKGGMGYGAGGGAGGYNGSRPTGGKGAPGVIYVEW